MPLDFVKMHGLGNDFVVLNATDVAIDMPPHRARAIADRRYGIGCDQILILDPETAPGEFGYRIVNADGSEVGQCGNGVRCIARFVRDAGLSDAAELRFATSTARMQVAFDGDLVRVNMGAPRFAAEQVPVLATAEAGWYSVAVAGEHCRFGAVSMGNPHAVLVVDSVERAPVERLGAALEQHSIFPDRVNVGFAEIVTRNEIRLRVWERGAGETLACGSGACAAMAVLRASDLIDEQAQVHLPGGALLLEWAGADAPLWMTGPAERVFQGQTTL